MDFPLFRQARSAQAPFDLGIAGLPEDVSTLLHRNLYGIHILRSDLRRQLILQLTLHALQQQREVAIVSPAAAKLSHALTACIGDDHWQRTVRIFERPVHCRDALRHYGAEQFNREIEALELGAGALVLADGADELFSEERTAAAAEVSTYRRLMRELDAIGLFLFHTREALAASLAVLGAARSGFSGIASLNGELGRLSWEVELWNSPTPRQRRFGLFLDKTPPWFRADGAEIDLLAECISGAHDESSVYYTRAIATDGSGIPADWTPLDSYAEALPAAEAAIGATIILHYARHRDLPELCRVIHVLRHQCGRGIKIVVRETGAHLRYAEEFQVMRAGASAVVYRDQRFARLLSAVESLHGHCFAGPIEPDIERTMAALTPEQVRGYVPPRAFCGLVGATLARTEAADLQHVLVRLSIRRDQAHVDALAAWQLSRANDLVTADDRNIYLFLFGCREPDVDATLLRLLSVPLAALFSEQVRWQRREGILTEIRLLAERGESQPFVDFSLLLPVGAPSADPGEEPPQSACSDSAQDMPGADVTHSAAERTPRSGEPVSPRPARERSVFPIRLRGLGQAG